MSDLVNSKEYKDWLVRLKRDFKTSQLKAATKVNSVLLDFYWQMGKDIVEKQKHVNWGQGFLTQLSKDLMSEFPDVKGFSKRNLEQIRRWYLFWTSDYSIAKQAASQLVQIPWWHNVVIITKCQSIEEASFYVGNTLKYGWSRSVLTHQIESGLWQREGKAISNFDKTLPAVQSDLAQQTLKDPYVFDFLTLTKSHNEKELEQGLTEHIEKFLLELGQGFAFVGRQYNLTVGEQDFFIDLLFYHLQLRCFVVIELKVGEFKPEYAGKMNFYCAAVDDKLKQQQDNPSIGLVLCQTKNKIIAEYALRDINTPIGVSEYQLTQSLPDNLKSSLPSIEMLEAELLEGFSDGE